MIHGEIKIIQINFYRSVTKHGAAILHKLSSSAIFFKCTRNYLEVEATTAMLALTKPGNKVVLTYTCNRVASTT